MFFPIIANKFFQYFLYSFLIFFYNFKYEFNSILFVNNNILTIEKNGARIDEAKSQNDFKCLFIEEFIGE